MRGQGRASRQVHLARESQWFWASGQENLLIMEVAVPGPQWSHDHGAEGGCRERA